MRRLLLLVVVALVVLLAPAGRVLSAQRCFTVPGIADCIASPEFDAFWNGNGALPVFGYPLTNERPEHNRDLDELFMTQWFERNRFEAHPENRPPYHVLLGRLGAELLQRQGRGVESVPAGTTPPGRCRAFDVGGARQFVCDPFLRYWETHGLEFDGRRGTSAAESLALFGLPLTTPRRETNPNGDTVLTQWFERARFEDHGARGVLLGLLGRETLATLPPVALSAAIVDGDSQFLLGGASGGRWLDAATTARALRGGETYRLWTDNGPAGQATGGTIRLAGEPCVSTVVVDLQPDPGADDAIAVGGSWNPRPRTAESLSTQSPVYRAAIDELLRGQGIRQPDVRLTRVLRVDLEGDGTDEVLISATRRADAQSTIGAQAGDYSLVALRQVAGGQVRTTLLEGQFFLEGQAFAAPDEFTIVSLLDLNGDGRLDVVVDSAYYEGAATGVYDVTARGVERVLLTGCGA